MSKMTAAELIAELQKIPADARVVIGGYEGGYHDVESVTPHPIRLDVNEEWYYGPHEDPLEGQEPDEMACLLTQTKPHRGTRFMEGVDLTDERWVADCMRWRGKVLTGKFRHWCFEWDGLPIDETTMEWPCGCFPDDNT